MTGDDDTNEQRSTPVTAAAALAVSSNYKVLGQLDDGSGIGILGQNDASNGTPVAVKGVTPNTTGGYGLATPDDARVGGSVATTGSHEVLVGDNRAMSLGSESGADAGNVVQGHSSNVVEDGAVGATIGGGGRDDGSTPDPNRVADDYGVVAGGRNNVAGDSSDDNPGASTYATVGGGLDNAAKSSKATIGGGDGNTITGFLGTVAGGTGHTISGQGGAIAGGNSNEMRAENGAVGGGELNQIWNSYGTISGGRDNRAAFYPDAPVLAYLTEAERAGLDPDRIDFFRSNATVRATSRWRSSGRSPSRSRAPWLRATSSSRPVRPTGPPRRSIPTSHTDGETSVNSTPSN